MCLWYGWEGDKITARPSHGRRKWITPCETHFITLTQSCRIFYLFKDICFLLKLQSGTKSTRRIVYSRNMDWWLDLSQSTPFFRSTVSHSLILQPCLCAGWDRYKVMQGADTFSRPLSLSGDADTAIPFSRGATVIMFTAACRGGGGVTWWFILNDWLCLISLIWPDSFIKLLLHTAFQKHTSPHMLHNNLAMQTRIIGDQIKNENHRRNDKHTL